MPASIVINQTGKPAGTPSQSRDDLALGTVVTLTNSTVETTYLWELLSKPVGSSAAIAGSILPVATFTPDVEGSYRIKLTTNSSETDIRIAAVKTTNLGLRKPATDEETEFDSVDGWGAAMQAAFDSIDADAGISLKTDGSNKPSADIDWDGNRIINLGSVRLAEGSDPAAAANAGSLYTKDVSGITELHYMDDAGIVTQITSDGYLDVFHQDSMASYADSREFVLSRETSTATPAELTFDGAVPGGTNRLLLEDDHSYFFTIQVIGRRTDANDEGAAFEFKLAMDRNTGAASTAVIGADLKTIVADDSAGAWDADVSADTTNGSLKIEVTGESGKTIRWVAFVRRTGTST